MKFKVTSRANNGKTAGATQSSVINQVTLSIKMIANLKIIKSGSKKLPGRGTRNIFLTLFGLKYIL